MTLTYTRIFIDCYSPGDRGLVTMLSGNEVQLRGLCFCGDGEGEGGVHVTHGPPQIQIQIDKSKYKNDESKLETTNPKPKRRTQIPNDESKFKNDESKSLIWIRHFYYFGFTVLNLYSPFEFGCISAHFISW